MILKHIPNILTLFRLLLIAPFLMFLYQQNYDWALYTFFLAGFTDALDGWLARHFHWQSNFGSLLDPVADKLLVISSFISLYLLAVLPWWLVLLVFMRDVSILMGAFLWFWFIQRKMDFEPTMLSKVNTAIQLGLVTFCLFQLAYLVFSPLLLALFISITTFTTAASYLDYLRIWSRKAWPPKQKAP